MFALVAQRLFSIIAAAMLAFPSTPVPVPTPAQSSTVMVWLSRTGSKYHSDATCSNMKNPYQVTLEDAEAAGRTPCKKCY